MPTLTIPNTFIEGSVYSAANIDANFAAITALINTTKLGSDNFRPLSGITNARKVKPYSNTPAVAVIPQISQAKSTTKSYRGMLALEHWTQMPVQPVDFSGAGGTVSDLNIIKGGGFRIEAIQGCHHGLSGDASAGDTLTLTIQYRPIGGRGASVYGPNDIFFDNVIQNPALSPALSGQLLDYFDAFVTYTTDATDTGSQHVLKHVTAVVWLSLPHVA